MALKNNLQQLEQRRQNQRHFNDAPLRVDVRQSVRDLRGLYPEMPDKQFSKWYEKRYHVDAGEVFLFITIDKEM